ncbi:MULTISPECIES: DUF6972 family protein [unclassified Microcoleus]
MATYLTQTSPPSGTNNGSRIPLYYAEIKIIKGTNNYHVIPRTKPRRTNQ